MGAYAERAGPGEEPARLDPAPAQDAERRSLTLTPGDDLPVSLATAVAEVLAVGERRELNLELRLQAWREGWLAGHEVGYRGGYAQAEKDMARRWREIARPVARGGPSFAELERRRWGPGGREHFADPRPGDYPGRGGDAA